MSTAPAFNWKNPQDVRRWSLEREKFWTELRRRNGLPAKTADYAEQQILGEFIPHVHGVPLAGKRANHIEYFEEEHQTLTDRLQEADPIEDRSPGPRRKYSALNLIGRAADGIVLAPPARAATPQKKAKARRMFEGELHKKANRELACGLMGGEIKCTSGHKFAVSYECGNRYCVKCGPDRATECFGKILGRIRLAAATLLDCGDPHCQACYWFRRGHTKKESGAQLPIPHWPLQNGEQRRSRVVIAILDFMLPKAGTPDRFQARRMNAAIKKTIRTLTRRAGLSRADYGYLFTDEYGARNTNLHAHGIWIGPRLDHREIARVWKKAIGSRDAIFTIRLCESLEPALFHAIKYPAKFGEHAAADWLAELEIAFHRVRRLHRLGAFYNMKKPIDEQEHDGRMKKCPACGDPLSEPTFNRFLSELYSEGLRDLRVIVREIGKAKTLLGVGLSPPIDNAQVNTLREVKIGAAEVHSSQSF